MKENSPLFRLSNKRKFAKLLNCSPKILIKVKNTRNAYTIWEKDKGNGEKRPIENPKRNRKKIQKKLNRLLSRIETPLWLKSGKKKESFVTNAKYHKDNSYFVCMDIKGFYQEVSRQHVFSAFKHDFCMSEDLAWITTDIVTIPALEGEENGYLPTGSPTSQSIAFWAYNKTFRAINDMASDQGVRFSLYVDDITLSSKFPIPEKLIADIRRRLSKVELSIKVRKTRRYKKNDYKIVTGCCISPDHKLLVPNKKMISILSEIFIGKNESQTLKLEKIKNMDQKQTQRLFGKINSCKQINGNAFANIYSVVKVRYMEFIKGSL